MKEARNRLIALQRWEHLSAFGITGHPGGKYATHELAQESGMKAGDNLLIIGCGDGNSVNYLVNSYDIIGIAIDLSFGMLLETKQRCSNFVENHQILLVQARGDALPFRRDTFDGVFAESVTLLMKTNLAFAEYYRVICPGGFIADNEPTWKPGTPVQVKLLTQQVLEEIGTGAVYAREQSEWTNELIDVGFKEVQVKRGSYNGFLALWQALVNNKHRILSLIISIFRSSLIIKSALSIKRWRYRGASRFLEATLLIGKK